MGVGREGVQSLCLWHMFMIELLRAACILLFSFCLNVTGGGVAMCGSGGGENGFCSCFAHVSILFECDRRWGCNVWKWGGMECKFDVCGTCS